MTFKDDGWTETEVPRHRSTLTRYDFSDVEDVKSSLFVTKLFKILGFQKEEREHIQLIVQNNGGQVTNKKELDFAILNDNFQGASKRKYDDEMKSRSLQWFFKSVYEGKIYDADEGGSARTSLDIGIAQNDVKKNIFPDEENFKTLSGVEVSTTNGGDTRDNTEESNVFIDSHFAEPLPTLFDGLVGYFDDSLSSIEKILQQHFVGYGGSVSCAISKRVTHYFANQSVAPTLIKYKIVNDNLKFVKPEWIYLCVNSGQVQPIENYLILSEHTDTVLGI
ncbi:hypothetical protein EIN_378200 [Entamoeba invadens IP1]|uniref:BRCT domain-containing protein n=1 Tax=Entamoeba invadens IP1 TaxID=370355 RepID=A0A0A1TUA6_ENTIV|nr:hypothetical protein EIN_378200 [Entamoeba invadens IP1]ELP83525.1 hypothetical protein EIN_378200 [Entamoeba invadens IP1]|eukprot:XP_004182871.1 hypothetical protein EIN_378200 [Entamoeba invadens IP1]